MNLHLSLKVLYSSLTNSLTPPAYSSLMNLLLSLTHPLSSLMILLSLMVPYSQPLHQCPLPLYLFFNSSLTSQLSLTALHSSLMNLPSPLAYPYSSLMNLPLSQMHSPLSPTTSPSLTNIFHVESTLIAQMTVCCLI